MDDTFRIVFVTVGSPNEAETIAKAIVSERLAACCNVLPGVYSYYRWEGKVEDGKEVLLIIKTTVDRLDALRERIVALHTYTVPEFIAIPIVHGHAPYLDWLQDSTRP